MDQATHTVLEALLCVMDARHLARATFEMVGRLGAKGVDFTTMSRALDWLDAHGYVKHVGDAEYAVTSKGLAARDEAMADGP